jgi:hypothetical protein
MKYYCSKFFLSEAEIQGLFCPALVYLLAWFQSLQLPSTQSGSPLAIIPLAPKFLMSIKVWTLWGSRYSDWLRAGRPRGRSLNPNSIKKCIFYTSSTPALGLTKPRIQWVPGALSRREKAAGAWSWPLPTSTEVQRMWIYTSTPQYAFNAFMT